MQEFLKISREITPKYFASYFVWLHWFICQRHQTENVEIIGSWMFVRKSTVHRRAWCMVFTAARGQLWKVLVCHIFKWWYNFFNCCLAYNLISDEKVLFKGVKLNVRCCFWEEGLNCHRIFIILVGMISRLLKLGSKIRLTMMHFFRLVCEAVVARRFSI